MHVLFASAVEKSYGDRVVLRDANLRVEPGDRIGLVGVNGAGKSTFLRILTGIESSDGGRVDRNGSVAILDQNPQLEGPTVADAMLAATKWHAELLQRYEDAISKGLMDSANALQDRLDEVGWSVGHNVEAYLQKLNAPPKSALVSTLSGGEKRRVALAKTLLSGADLLILDEPTNHLDAQTIDWLESHLKGLRSGILLVTHDRYLLETVATRIVEIEDGETVDYLGSYGDYLVLRAERQARLQVAQTRRMKLIAQEAEWAARSPAARSTKQKARLQRLDALLEVRNLKEDGSLSFGFHSADKFGRTLLDAQDVGFAYGRNRLFWNLRFSLPPKTRLGIIGPNGAGKSTLLKVISGELEIQSGALSRAGRLKLGIMDQRRSGLKSTDTVFEAAGGGADQVRVGENYVHVATFLDRFLFGREMRDQLVGSLSGGERARLLLAKLMLSGANLILLDEPTNDLDLLTLRSLEDALIGFEGAVVIVTHDRAFLDRVATSVLSFEGGGKVTEYADRMQAQSALEQTRVIESPKEKKVDRIRHRERKLSYREKRELESLPETIEGLEGEHEELSNRFNDPNIYKDSSVDIADLNRQLTDLESQIAKAYERWESLSEIEGA